MSRPTPTSPFVSGDEAKLTEYRREEREMLTDIHELLTGIAADLAAIKRVPMVAMFLRKHGV